MQKSFEDSEVEAECRHAALKHLECVKLMFDANCREVKVAEKMVADPKGYIAEKQSAMFDDLTESERQELAEKYPGVFDIQY